ncbi:MAG: heme-binding Shp domain-containing protein [Roseburia sp.]
MKKKIWSKKSGKFFGGMVMAAIIAAISIPVYAMQDGAYTVGRTTSYANPETGVTVDGGTNIALGDSMCASIVEETALVEQYQGRTYITLGIGLMSNVSNVRIQIQGLDGTYREVGITQTGSCSRNGDTCNHYRFEVDSADNYISPILYVAPMGRDVQFFVKLNMGSATAGTGNFVSEMIPVETTAQAAESSTTPAENTSLDSSTTEKQRVTDQSSETQKETSQGEDETALEAEDSSETLEEATESLEEETESIEDATEELTTEKTEWTRKADTEPKEKKKGNRVVMVFITIAVVAVLAGGIGYGIYRKKRM